MTIPTLSPTPVRGDPDTFSTAFETFLSGLDPWAAAVQAVGDAADADATAAAAAAVSTAADAVSTAADAIATAADAAATAIDAATATAQAASVAALDKRYLGSFAVAPTLDNQGDPLATGAVYYDTALAKVETWNGSAWVEGISSVAGVTTVNGQNGAITIPTLPPGASIYTALNFGAF